MPAPLIGLAVGAAARAVAKKAAQKAVKKVATKTAVKANARALKAAKGPSLAKGAAKTAASSGKSERNITNITAKANMEKGLSRKEAYAKSAKTMDNRISIAKEESKKILARAAAEKKAKTISKALKSK